MVPKAALVGEVFTLPNVTWLVTLKASNRNCKYLCSPKMKFLSIDTSSCLVASRRKLLKYMGNVRMLSASCWLDTVLKRVVSKAVPLGCCGLYCKGPP